MRYLHNSQHETLHTKFSIVSRIFRAHVRIRGDELLRSTNISMGDTLNELPQLHSTFSQSNSPRSLGTAGLILLDPRGLGTQRTLVLVNGHRHVDADVLNASVSSDMNTFPNELLAPAELVTGTNSAVNGSDAVAGRAIEAASDENQRPAKRTDQ